MTDNLPAMPPHDVDAQARAELRDTARVVSGTKITIIDGGLVEVKVPYSEALVSQLRRIARWDAPPA